jgi:uncharacterized protein YdeI (YjbR/CyaY-like superfamily)
MVTSNKDAAKIWAEIEKARAVGTEVTVEDAKNLNNAPGRGPNDLEERIEDLMKINLSHQNLNADLRKECRYQTDQAKFYKLKAEQLEKENKELRRMGASFIDEHRNKGNI